MSHQLKRHGLFDCLFDALTSLKQGRFSDVSLGGERFMRLDLDYPLVSEHQATLVFSMFSMIVMRQEASSHNDFSFGIYGGGDAYNFIFRIPEDLVLNDVDLDADFMMLQDKLSNSLDVDMFKRPDARVPFVTLGPIPLDQREFFEDVFSYLHHFGDDSAPLDFSRYTERDGQLFYYIAGDSYRRCFDYEDDFSPVLEEADGGRVIRTLDDLNSWSPGDGSMN